MRDYDLDGYFYEWRLPPEARKGDIGVLFAGGRRRCYLGTEVVDSNWRTFRTGSHQGEYYVEIARQRLLSVPVAGAEVVEAIGLALPSGPMVLPEPDGARLVAFLRRRRSSTAESAIEGILTEARCMRRSRSSKLRRLKLDQSKGRCEACGRSFLKMPRGLDGMRLLTVHHRDQLSQSDDPPVSTLADLAVLCANCHMLVHSDPRKAMSVEDVAALLQGSKPRRGR